MVFQMQCVEQRSISVRLAKLFALMGLIGLLTAPSASAAIVLRIEGDQVIAGETAIVSFFLDDTDDNPTGLDLEGFNIPVLLDGLTLDGMSPASDGFFGPQNLNVANAPALNAVDRADVVVSQFDSRPSGFLNTGGSAKLFQLEFATSLADSGQSFTINTDPLSFFFQLDTTDGNIIVDSVTSGTVQVVAVPEPISGIVLLGLTGIVCYRRRK